MDRPRTIAAAWVMMSAATVAGQEPAPARSSPERIEANAVISIEFAGRPQRNTTRQKLELVVEPELRISLPFRLKLTAIGRGRADAFDSVEPGDPPLDELSRATRPFRLGDRVELELRELQLQRAMGQGLLTLGKQQVVWGRSDGLRVLDLVNPQDFREFILDDLGDSRIPLWMANVELPVRDFVVQALWIPDPSAHRLPPPNAPFAFTAPSLRPGPPPPFEGTIAVDRPDDAFTDADAGVRVARSWKGWDLTANYLYRYDDRPVISGRAPVTLDAAIPSLSAAFKRSHVGGASFATAYGPVALRGEIAATFDLFLPAKDPPTAAPVRTPVIAYVIGCDWLAPGRLLLSAQVFQDRATRHT